MFCKKCGKRISDESLVCENCGTVIVSETEENIVAVKIEKENTEILENNTNSLKESELNKSDNYRANDGQQSSLNKKQQTKKQILSDELPEKEDKVRTVILSKRRKINKKPIIIGVIALLLCLTLVVLTFPYIKNTFARLCMSSEDYFTYVVKNNTEDSAKSIANTLDNLKRATVEGDSVTGTADVAFEKPFHDILADVTGDIKIGGMAGNVLGSFADLTVGGMTEWIDNVFVSYELNSDGTNSQSLLELKVNDADFGTIDIVKDNKKGVTHIGIPDYREEYFIAGENENKDDGKPFVDVVMSLPEKELTEKLIMEYIECFAENAGDIEEKTKTMDAGAFNKKTVALIAEIDKDEMNVITTKLLDKIKNDKDMAEIIKKTAGSSGKSEAEVRKSLEKAFKDFNIFYANEIKGNITITFYVDAKGKIIGTSVESSKFEYSNCTIIKWFEIGNSIRIKAGIANIELTGNGKLEDNKVRLDYVALLGGSHVADIKIYDLDYKKSKEGLYDANVNVTFDENVAKIGGMLLDTKNQESISAKLIKYVPDISLDIGIVQSSAEETSLSVNVNHKEKIAVTMELNNKNGEKKNVEIPKKSSEFGLNDVVKLPETMDVGSFIDFLKEAEYPKAEQMEKAYDKIESAYKTASVAKSVYNFIF